MPRSNIQLGGQELKLDADADTSITVDTDDRVDIKVAGTDKVHITSTGLGVGTNAPTDTAGFGIALDVSSSSGGAVYVRDAGGSKTGHFGQFNEQTSIVSRQDDGNIAFYTGASPSEKIRIASNGNVGIGTTSPNNKLDVNGGIVCSPNTDGKDTFELSTNDLDEGRLEIKNVDTTTVRIRAGGDSFFNGGNVGIGTSSVGAKLHVQSGDGSITPSVHADDLLVEGSANCGITVGSGTSSIGSLRFADSGGDSQGNITYNHSDNTFSFATDDTEAMKINSSQEVVFGNNDPSDDTPTLGFQIDHGGGTGTFINIGHTSSATSGYSYARYFYNGGNIGSIAQNGTTGVNYFTSSDYRLKENVVTDWDATSRLKQLKPSRFNFKTEKDRTVDGFLAHEVSSIVPEAITGEKDAVDKEGNIQPQGIDQSKLVPLLTKALQESIARADALEARIKKLEGS